MFAELNSFRHLQILIYVASKNRISSRVLLQLIGFTKILVEFTSLVSSLRFQISTSREVQIKGLIQLIPKSR